MILRSFLHEEEGQVLPGVLIALLMGVSFIVPAIIFANSALIAQRTVKNTVVDEYTADSAISYVMWRLLDTSYATTPPASQAVTINGSTVNVSITKLNTGVNNSIVADYTVERSVSSYAMTSGRQLWLVAANDDAAHGVYLAYDTTNAPSQLRVPWTSGTKTYYLHNYPTPPTGDTALPNYGSPNIGYDALGMNETVPTATTLYNYDTTTDSVAGRTVVVSTVSTQCSGAVVDTPNKRVVWRSPTLTSNDSINGTVKITWWWGLADNAYASHGIHWYLCDFNTASAVSSVSPYNPANVVARIDVPITTSVWTNPFDLSVTVGGKTIRARVDRIDNLTIYLRSWTRS